MRQEILIHFELIGVFIVIGCLVSDLLLSCVSLDSALERRLFIVEGLEHGSKSVFSLEVVLVNESHQLLKSMLCLQSLLLSMAIPFRFFHVNGLLVFVAVLRLVEADLNGDQVGVHPVDHVLSLSLDHFGLIMLIFDGLKSVQGLVQS